jgi:hypothetical protein
VHTVRFDYIIVNDTPDVKIEFHGKVGADTVIRKLFEHVFENVKPSVTNPSGAVPSYVGPNSSQLGSVAGLVIKIGKVGTVVLETIIDSNVASKKAVSP